MNNVITLKLSKNDENKLFSTFKSQQSNPPQYAKWQLRLENCVVTCYESGKTVFQGSDATIYASAFMKNDDEIYPQAGSDEVGTGDYFGPVTVCASIVNEKDIDFLKKLGIRDSKQINDEEIRKIAPNCIENIHHSLLIVNNEKYNNVHINNNLNKIKALLHNKAYVNLSKKEKLPSFKIIDQFTPEKNYYNYIKNEPLIIRDIHFETKAENKYLSVAVSSIIARYAFLTYMDDLEKKYNMKFQKGAGPKVDICAKGFINKYGKDELIKVAKLHFKNTDNVL